MNSAVLIEPRKHKNVTLVLENFKQVLKDWKFVFYCGKDMKIYWESILEEEVEIRELLVNNLDPRTEYNDLLKSKSFWEEQTGNYVLIFQSDTWLYHNSPYTIDMFTSKEYSYIGSNLSYPWYELQVLNKDIIHKNFNGGLSLRKRIDMLKIINYIPPKKTIMYNSSIINNDILDTVSRMAEDVYFTLGCYLLKLKIGDDELCRNFSCHSLFVEKPFGYHQPVSYILNQVLEDCPSYANII